MRWTPALVVVFTLALSAGPAEATVTFGANLSRQPNLSYSCGSFDSGFYPPGTFDSCSWDFVELNTGESVFPPVGIGVIPRVRIRVGPTTGPMQVVVEEALRRNNPGDPGHPTYVCCKAIQVSQVFTPAPNAITTVPVTLRVRQDIAPDPTTGFYVDDHLALSVLARNVPIPASQDPKAYDSGWFPAWQQGQERTGPYGTSGAVILFNADWDQATGPGPGTPGLGVGRPTQLGNGTARLPVTVPGPGRLVLTDDRVLTHAGLAISTSAAAKTGRVKRVNRTVTKASTIVLKITPSKTGMRTLRKKHKLKLKVRITFTPAGAKTSTSKTASVTLKLKG